MIASVVAHDVERFRHVHAFSLGDHSFRLFDRDAAVQRVLELLVEDLRLERGTVLEYRDRRNVGQRFGGSQVGPNHLSRLDTEEVERADDRPAQSHGNRVHGPETGGDRFGGESRPARAVRGQIAVRDRLPGAITVETGTLLRLQLEQLQDAHRLAGGRHHA